MSRISACSASSIIVIVSVSTVLLWFVSVALAADETGLKTPAENYSAYRDALVAGDISEAREYLASAKIYELIGKDDDDAIASLKVLDPITGLEIIDESVDGDHATVTARGEAMGMTAVGTIEMIRENGGWKVLGELWNLGGDPDAGEPVEPGATLQEAARAGDDAAVMAAIDSGADINAWGDNGRTALSWAANYGHTETMDLLIMSGADVNRADEGGETPLMIAAGAGEPDALALMVEAGVDVNAVDESGRTTLHRVAGMSDWSIDRMPNGEADAVRMVHELFRRDTDADYADPWQHKTALMLAAENGRTEVVRALIEVGADVNRPIGTDDGTTAVMEAAKSGNVETFRVLVDSGADLGCVDMTGRTIVDWAADHPEIVEILKEKGVEGADSVTSSLEEMRCAEDDPQPAIDRLKAKGYAEISGDLLLSAAAKGDSEAVMLFLRAGIPVNFKDPYDHASTALNRAIAHPSEADTALILISCGGDPNAGMVPPLFNAAQKCEFTEVVEALLDAGADVDSSAPSGFSALQMAGVMKCEDNARILREAGAVEK